MGSVLAGSRPTADTGIFPVCDKGAAAYSGGMKTNFLLLTLAVLPLAMHAIDDTTPEPATTSAQPAADFKSLDADGDGRLSVDEFTAPAAVHRAAKQGRVAAAGTASGPDPLPQAGVPAVGDSIEGRYSPEVFKNLDIDHDRFVSPQEFAVLGSSAHNISQP